MRKKGFTILETMISVTIFSVLMIIVFSCWTEFQKVALKNEAKHDTNIQFVNVYRNIDKIVSSSSVRLFQYYWGDNPAKGAFQYRRWFAFLLSRRDNKLDGKLAYDNIYFCKTKDCPYYFIGKDQPTECPQCHEHNFSKYSQRLIYNTCVVYLLYYKQGCCGSFQNCPHKSLYRYVFQIQPTYFANNKIWGDNFLSLLDNQVKNIVANPTSNSISKYSVIENNIVDIKIIKEDDKIRFDLSLLRINDAERHFKIGTKQLTSLDPTAEFTPDTEVKKYMENISWISVPGNT